MFNRRKELEQRIQELEKMQKKGYFGGNENNDYLKEVYRYAYQLSEFSDVNNAKLVNYYKNNAVVRGLLGTQIGDTIAEISDYIELVDSNNNTFQHWAMDLLNKPNDLDSKKMFLKGWSVFYNTTGMTFTYFENELGSKKKINSMYNLPSHRIGINSGGWKQPIKSFILEGSISDKLDPTNTMYIREFNPEMDSLFGLSPLQAAANVCELLDTSDKRQLTAISNGSVAGIITPKADEVGVTPDQRDEAEKKFNTIENTNKNIFLPIGIEYIKMGSTPADLSVLETSKNAVTALSFVFGVPIDVFYGQSKYENAKEAKKTIITQAALPRLNLFLEAFTERIRAFDQSFNARGGKFIVNTDKIDILKNSPLDSMALLDKAGASINERREYLGYPRLTAPYADLPVIPLGVSLGDPNNFDINENQ